MKKEILNGRNLSKVLRLPSLIMIAALTVFSGCTDEDTTPSINEDFMNEMEAARMKMMENMHAVPMTMDPDVDFAEMMLPHHQGAVDMASIVLEYGEHENLLMLAQQTLEGNEASMARLNDFLEAHGAPVPQDGTGFMEEMDMAMRKMDEVMKAMHYTNDPDYDFAEMMIHHHQSAIDMAKIELDYGVDENTRMEAQTIIEDQEAEIIELAQFRNGHGQPE
ncbi:DUF305 domain-containing protein [uncultured Algoriphagus sp.]|uniref:DUF305 domain-containing protein n=1 Tax=Algoriphagus sp. TaxID=1872435 RepID=UPI0030ECE5F4|tara:strand:+ start:55680 stop:56342 length:663 start_codon:yes stop_codon:yes gene_type:complete